MTTLLQPGFEAPALEPAGDWHPARFTPSLTGDEHFVTDADRLLPFVCKHWRSPETSRFELDVWQTWLLRHVLERYPDDWHVAELRGQLRYRQVVISIGRQNGKSILAALLALYFLCLHLRGPRVVGLASIDRQAKIVYDRVKFAVEANEALRRVIKATATRGIRLADGTGLYQTLPADEDSAQGEPITGCLYDELHLGLAALWDAIVLGQRAKINSLLVGLTTAGDADSALLIRLYDEGEVALSGDDERFGFFVWEAADPINGESYTLEDVTADNIIRANPAVACGRVPLRQSLADARKMWTAPPDEEGVPGRDRVIRYALNKFLEGSTSSWAPLPAWRRCAGSPRVAGDVVYSIDRTRSWEHATITATVAGEDKLESELVASIASPNQPQLVAMCKALAERAGSATFAVDGKTLSSLGKELRKAGLDVYILNENEMSQAAAIAHSAIVRGRLVHAGDRLLGEQMTVARRRDVGDTWRISRALSAGDVDAVIATVAGLYVAETTDRGGDQVF